MTPDFAIVSNKTVGKRIAANTGLLVAAKAFGAFIGLFTLIITERALDNQVAFGTVLFLHAYMLFFSEVATFQSWQSLIRFGTDDVKNRDVDEFSTLLRFGITLDFLSAVAAFLAAIGLFSFVTFIMMKFPELFSSSEALDPKILQGFVFLYCTVVLTKQVGTSIGILRLFDRFKGLAYSALVMPMVRFTGAVIAYKLGWGLTGFVAVWYVSALAGNFAVIILGVAELTKRKFIRPILAARTNFTKPRKGLWSFVWKSNIDSTLAAGSSHLPTLLVMAVFGPAFLAVYRIAEETAKLLSEGVKLLDQVIYPELARMISGGDVAKIWRLVTRAALISMGVGLLVSIFIALAGPYVFTTVLGPEYQSVTMLAILLVFGAAIFAAAAPLYPVFYATDKPHRAIYARIAGLIIYIIAFFTLCHVVGEMGAAWAYVAGQLTGLLIVAFLVKKTLVKAVARAVDKSVIGDRNV